MDMKNRTRREFLKTLGLGSLGLGSLALAPSSCLNAPPSPAGKEGKLPNIVLILADDMGWSDPGCYGGEICTPHLDSLAERGVRFTQFYNTAKCFPSRACLLTGLYAQQCGMNRKPAHLENCVTLAELLRTRGYRTLMAGKHHGLDHPMDRGFDRYFGLRDGACNYFNPGRQREGEGVPAQKRPDRVWCVDEKVYTPYTPEEGNFYTTDYFTNHALDYLDAYKDEDQPFFLYLAYTAPHDPLMAWPEDIARYRGKYRRGWEETRGARYERQKEMGLIRDNAPLSEKDAPDWDSLREEEKDEWDLKMAVYAAQVDRMDQNMGRVLARIRDLGEEGNTLVLFCSDNGGSSEVVRKGDGEIGTAARWASIGKNWANVSNTPFRKYKNQSHEGGICSPLIACWPGVIQNKGAIIRHPGHFIDLMATFAEISGATYPDTFRGAPVTPLEGQSLLPLFLGNEPAHERTLFWQWSQGKAVRRGPWKLVSWGKDAPWELYDLAADRTELNDLASSQPERVQALEALFLDWKKRCPAGTGR